MNIMLSKKSKYALKALGYLAANNGTDPVLMSQIANERNIPLPFLENIFHQLKREGVLISHRGRYGGYMLSRPAKEIYVVDILRIVNGPIAPLGCSSLNFYQPCEDCIESECTVKNLTEEIRDAILISIKEKTLADLV